MSNLLAAIKGREAEVSDAHTEVIGTLDGSPVRFTSVELKVTAKYSDRELFEKLVEIADRGCIMMNTLRGKLDINVRIAALV
jgi:putative redox protein